MQGTNFDGRSFAPQALAAGAVAVVSEAPPLPDFSGTWIQVPHARKAMALLARKLYLDPAQSTVKVYGVTGTNGKTTVSYLLASVLEAAGYTTALFGTVEYRIGKKKLESINTTPESVDLYRYFGELLESAGGDPVAVAMEASSHALALGRIWGLHFHGAVWTNLTQDHLDFHGSMENYKAAKFELFRGQDAPAPSFAAVNHDDETGRELPLSPATAAWSFGLHSPADVRARDISCGYEGTKFTVESPLGSFTMESALLGDINVSNILAAATVALRSGIAIEAVREGVRTCGVVPGRFEPIRKGQPFYVVCDYAHTDDALRNVLRVARALQPARIITVFGCGGDRDRTKRPLMGAAAAEASDYVVLTSDNPRTEDPLAILNDALVGISRYDTPYHVEPDRSAAIRHALSLARPGDLVLIAGKGHETYQIIGKTKIPFDDRLVAAGELDRMGYSKEGE
jgi:UDP-N-acetylmuramoyl-L-alanyl-D-glutamate--2,6-diaminopimelate ligase